MDNLNNIPFLFIVGRPRSGTTLLRTLFDAHSNVVIPPECQFVVNLYGKYGKKHIGQKRTSNTFFRIYKHSSALIHGNWTTSCLGTTCLSWREKIFTGIFVKQYMPFIHRCIQKKTYSFLEIKILAIPFTPTVC